jgi:hypothetical protein
MRLRLISMVMATACLTTFAASAFADPPGRVGRVSRVEGAVTVLGPDPGTADTAAVNYPAAAGMKFSSGSGSRAELDFGTTRARIDGRSDLEIQALDDNVLGLRLTLGSVDVRVTELEKDERITIGTSDGQVVLAKAGAYRIDAPGQGASGMAPYRAVTHVAVLDGVARIYSPHGGDDVFAGEAVDIDAPHGTLRYGRAESIRLDDWADGREREIAAAAESAARYVDADIAGGAQLSDAGAWEETPDYGAVWYPDAVPADWAPYQYGTWTWVAPWGWTWVDDQPWGFAPFHYGRWVHVHGRWGWCPPRERHHRHIYAPALVTFVGDHRQERRVRPNGWIPLRPGETYTPPYAHGANYVRDINRDHDGRWDRKGGRGNTGAGNIGMGNNGSGNTGGNAVITTTVRLPDRPGDNNDGHRHRHRTGNDDSAPITITNETFRRRPQPSVPAPVGAVAPLTSKPSGAPPGPVAPMTTNPAGPPPGPVMPLPVAPQVTPAAPRPDMGNRPEDRNDRQNDHRNDHRHRWMDRNPDPHNAQTPLAVPQQAVPHRAVPRTVDVLGAGRVQIPAAVSPAAPAMPSQPVYQPMVPRVPAPTLQPPAAPAPLMKPPSALPPHGRSIFIPGVGNVPANIGRGNLGQGNVGAPGP